MRTNPDFAWARVSDENGAPLTAVGSAEPVRCDGKSGQQFADSGRLLQVSTPIVDSGKTSGMSSIGGFPKSAARTRRQASLDYNDCRGARVTILITLASGAYLSRSIAYPVTRLAEAVARVEHGEWDARIEVGSADEVGQLARGFRSMLQEPEALGRPMSTTFSTPWPIRLSCSRTGKREDPDR